ncbi:hypothetical protein RIF29_21027 [Crotalaria pallida]|uniref:Uncharacterized protein n=1 Tax=Crotalaria pallida TaxID=3830 RepID=A0AAN9I808_CROPI
MVSSIQIQGMVDLGDLLQCPITRVGRKIPNPVFNLVGSCLSLDSTTINRKRLDVARGLISADYILLSRLTEFLSNHLKSEHSNDHWDDQRDRAASQKSWEEEDKVDWVSKSLIEGTGVVPISYAIRKLDVILQTNMLFKGDKKEFEVSATTFMEKFIHRTQANGFFEPVAQIRNEKGRNDAKKFYHMIDFPLPLVYEVAGQNLEDSSFD